MAKPVRTTKPGRIRTTHSQGIGYYIPDSMANSEWHRIKQIWDQKLKQSSFNDIELFSHALDGHFLPTFSQNSININKKYQTGAIGDGIAGYYDYCSTFYEHCDWRATCNTKVFGRRWKLMQHIFRLHKDGVSLRDIVKAIKGVQSNYMKRFSVAMPPAHIIIKRGLYYYFHKVEQILEHMWLWQATNELGSLTPYDLKHMQATGITAAVIAKAEAIVAQRSTSTSIAPPASNVPTPKAS